MNQYKLFFTILLGCFLSIIMLTETNAQWSSQTSGTTNNLKGVSFADEMNIIIVGVEGIILKSTDGGTTWGPLTSGTPQWLSSVSFTDANTGEVVGTAGANLRTTDGGATWLQQTSGTAVLYDVSFTNANTGTVVGENGTILRMSSTTGIEDNTIKIPTNFVLLQNYPNPFNPSTRINFTIPHKTVVSLSVFSLTGSEVAELVNGEMEAGSYNIDFNAANLPSGVYFYKIQSDNFVQTKKMLLMK